MLIFLFYTDPVKPQGTESIELIQFFVGNFNVGSGTTVVHTITPVSFNHNDPVIWKYDPATGDFDHWLISTPSSVSVTGNSPDDHLGSEGFGFPWLDASQEPFYYAFYKVTNSLNPNAYFYIDIRDANYNNPYGPDFAIRYDHDEGQYRFSDNIGQGLTWPYLNNGDVLRIWEIFDETPDTYSLPYYWSHAVLFDWTKSADRHPRLLWGPYTAPGFTTTAYKIYASGSESGSYSLVATVNAQNFEYLDYNWSFGGMFDRYYKIKAYDNSSGLSSFSNHVQFEDLWPAKSQYEQITDVPSEYSLEQNFPNPFNPATTIKYTLKEKEFVKISVFNAMGQKVATLINQNKEPGRYSVEFDGSELSSGIYFYTINAGDFRDTKKMALMK